MHMVTVLLLVFWAALSYGLFVYFNDPIKNPEEKKNRLPQVKYKNIEILPYFRVHIKSKTYHIHHWLTLTIIVGVSLFWYEGASHLVWLKGVALGGLFQGLRYPSRFKFRNPRQK